MRRKDSEQAPRPWAEQPSQFEEDRSPDRSRDEHARYENAVGDVKYSREGRKHNSHARNVTPDDDRPGPPAVERPFRPCQPAFVHPDEPAEALDEGPPIAPADGGVDGGSDHRP